VLVREAGHRLFAPLRGLSIWDAGDEQRAHFQRYPVIHFNFKGSKGPSLSHALDVIQKRIRELFDEHRYLLASERLSDLQVQSFRAVLDGTATRALHEAALRDLSAYLRAHHGRWALATIRGRRAGTGPLAGACE
jgi:hypothetical protein